MRTIPIFAVALLICLTTFLTGCGNATSTAQADAVESEPNSTSSAESKSSQKAEPGPREGEIQQVSATAGKRAKINADQYFAKASHELEIGNRRNAVLLLNTLLTDHPQHARGYQMRAGIFANAGLHTAAISDLSKALQVQSNDANLYNLRGFLRLATKEYQAAIDDFSAALKLNPKFAKAYNNRGLARVALKDFTTSINDFNEALILDEKYVDAYNNRGYAYLEMGSYAKANENFTEAINLNPEYVNSYNNRGMSAMKLGQFEAAIQDFSKAIELAPMVPKHYLHRREAYLTMGRDQLAQQDATQVEWLQLLQPLNRNVQTDPENPRHYLTRAKHLFNGDEILSAVGDIEKALELDPSLVDAKLLKAEILAAQGQHADVIRVCNDILTKEENPLAYSLRGDAHLGLNQLDEAITDFNAAQRFDESVALAYSKRAELKAKSGDKTAANADREQAKKITQLLNGFGQETESTEQATGPAPFVEVSETPQAAEQK